MQTMRILWRFTSTSLRTYAAWFVGGILFLYLTNWMAVQIPLEIKTAVDLLHHGAPASQLRHTALIILTIGLGMMIIRTLSRLLFFTPGRYIERDIRDQIFAHLLKLQPDYYDTHKPGEIVSKLIHDIGMVRALAGYATLQSINVVVGIGLAVYRMLSIDPTVTVYCILPMALIFIFIQSGIRRMFKLTRQSQVQLASLSEFVLGTYNGIGVIRSFHAEAVFDRRFDDRNEATVATNIQLSKLRAFLVPMLALMGNIGIFILLYFGGRLVAHGRLSVGELSAMIGLIAVMLPALMSLGWLMGVIQRGISSLERLYQILDTTPSIPLIPEIATQSPSSLESGKPVIPAKAGIHKAPKPVFFLDPRLRGDDPSFQTTFSKSPDKENNPASLLIIQNLSFSYPTSAPSTDVLHDLPFSLERGEIVGLFGQTGAGKSTLFSVLLRLYNPPTGTIFLHGRDALSYPLDEYRRYFAYVPQRPFLFSDTIARNIEMGADRPLSEAEIETLLVQSELAGDVATFPNGIHTLIGPRGVTLSGGQRQRLALARALASDAPILLLDDVLSAVDHATEERLIRHLYTQKRTMLIASHRLSVLRRAHRILVLENGHLTASGTHDALIHSNDLYARIWENQQLEDAAETMS